MNSTTFVLNGKRSVAIACALALSTVSIITVLPMLPRLMHTANGTTNYYLVCDQFGCFAQQTTWHQCGSGYYTQYASNGLVLAYWWYQNTCSNLYYCVTSQGYFTSCTLGPIFVSRYVHAIETFTSWFKWTGVSYVFDHRFGPWVSYTCNIPPYGNVVSCAFV